MLQLTPRLKRYTLLAAGLALATGLFFGSVSPYRYGSAVIFIGFGLLAADVYLATLGGLYVSRRLLNHPQLHLRRRALITAGVVSALVALQSIGQLGFKDTIAVLVVCVILYFYSSYYRFGVAAQRR